MPPMIYAIPEFLVLVMFSIDGSLQKETITYIGPKQGLIEQKARYLGEIDSR